MSGDSGETNRIPQETETISDNNINEPEKKDNRIYCTVCQKKVSGQKNFEQHLTGQKHLKKLSLLSSISTREEGNSKTPKKQDSKTRTRRQQDTRQNTGEKNTLTKIAVNNSSEHSDMNFKEKNQNRSFLFVPINETMNNSSNRYDQNNRYHNRSFENRYSKYPNDKYNYPNNYRNDKQYYNNRYNWHSYSGQNHNFDYRSRHYYSQSGYNAPYENNYPSENRHLYFNPYSDYGENSNSGSFEQNLDNVTMNKDERSENPAVRNPFSSDISPVEIENPFKQRYSKDSHASSKSSKEKLDSEINVNKTNEAGVNNTSESAHSSKDNTTSPKLQMVLSKHGKKRIIYRSRSLSSSESEKKGKSKTDQADSEESEEQRIQEWTNSLLETSNNQITRLVNPSNHKEKAAVNHLITKFSKSKRKEILTRTLRTNSAELTDNDDKDVNNEDQSAESESVTTEDDEISIVLDSKVSHSNLEQKVTNFSAPSTSKTKNSNYNNTNQKQNNESVLESSKFPLKKNSKKYNKNDENIKKNNFTSNKFLHSNNNPLKHKEKLVKRKSVGSDTKVKKKQKTTSIRNSNVTCTAESKDLNKDDSRTAETSENFFCPPGSEKLSNPDTSTANIKEELLEITEGNTVDPSTSTTNSEKRSGENLVFSPDVSVETLIQLFASGNVKVKEEYNDPVMEALKDINPDELMNAYSNNPVSASEETIDKASNSTNRKNSKDKSSSETSINTLHNKNSIDPVILGSAAVEDSSSPSSASTKTTFASACAVNDSASSSVVHQTEPVPSTSSINHNSERCSSSCADGDKSFDYSFLNFHEITNTKVELPPYLNKLIKQLQDITSEEEEIKQNLIEAKSKISMYASLLEEWKEKKKLLNEQEETLRKQRNDIIKLMQDAAKTDSDDDNKKSRSSSPKDDTFVNQVTSTKKQNTEKNNAEIIDGSKVLTPPSSVNEKQQKRKKTESHPASPESDEVIVLPAPPKPQPPEIIICDDEENIHIGNQNKVSRHEANNILSNKRSAVYETKTIDAHTTVINSLVVFEDFLYTCSNDNTAKRFSLKDASLSVTYLHSAKNVTEIVVEKVQNEALVFTACSSKLISLFIAASGTKIKNFFPPCPAMSICKGWGKFYAGLANGTVNMYNWKYEEIEIVKTEQPASRIATAHQGRLHVLIILSNEGNIAIRDAETGLLIRYVKINIKHPSWMCLHNDLVYLSSSDKSLIILDIMSGKIEKKLYMNCHTTGLAVYDDYIFTISYNGVINCYNKDKICDKRLFYGVGKGGLTCIHIYQNWVFTGNRKGDVSLFHFDPSSLAPCEFAKCDFVYGLKEDLEYHIEKDHLQKKKMLTQCNWRGCNFKFPRGADIVDKMNHVRTHIYEMNYLSTIS